MKVFLIRHAQSIDDQAKVSQRDDSPLSQLGEEQAEKRANSLAISRLDGVYASPYARTQETAAILFPGMDITTLDFIYEIKRPRSLDGGLHADAVHFWEVDHKQDKYRPDWTYDDSESFNDVLNRSKKLMNFLYSTHRDDHTVAVVSHGGFIRHTIGYAGLGDNYTPEVFFDLFFLMQIKNTDVIEADFQNGKLTGWKIHNS